METGRIDRCNARARPRVALVLLAVPCGLAARSAPARADGPSGGGAATTTVTIPGGPVIVIYAPPDGTVETTADGGGVRVTWTGRDGDDRTETTTDACTCMSPAVEPDPFAVSAPASAPLIAVPQAGAVIFGMRFPWDVESLPDGVGVGVGGIGLDLGVRVADRLYLGASADWEAVIDSSGSDYGPGEYNRIRAGGELRYYLHAPRSSGSSGDLDDGAGVATQTWVGLRAGVERYRGDLASGRFADLTIGDDFWFGPVGMALYLSAGAGDDPASAFGSQDPSTSATPDVLSGSGGPAPAQPAAPTTTSPYLTFGMSILFG